MIGKPFIASDLLFLLEEAYHRAGPVGAPAHLQAVVCARMLPFPDHWLLCGCRAGCACRAAPNA
eukprot:11442037-Alexandrium_andersonii.AAC.1